MNRAEKRYEREAEQHALTKKKLETEQREPGTLIIVTSPHLSLSHTSANDPHGAVILLALIVTSPTL